MNASATPASSSRPGWISLINRAPRAALMQCWQALRLQPGFQPGFDWIRKPEFGLVMLRGRIGGTGGQFNLGEATVTRCALKLREPEGRDEPLVGLGMVLGRDAERARTAALIDALLQDPAHFEAIVDGLLRPLEEAVSQSRAQRAGAAAATKVEFFTMVRGE
jgi:alpha-D-ribose 1-methylphosphonate 5-triphosphate synthase subunit PhnG